MERFLSAFVLYWNIQLFLRPDPNPRYCQSSKSLALLRKGAKAALGGSMCIKISLNIYFLAERKSSLGNKPQLEEKDRWLPAPSVVLGRGVNEYVNQKCDNHADDAVKTSCHTISQRQNSKPWLAAEVLCNYIIKWCLTVPVVVWTVCWWRRECLRPAPHTGTQVLFCCRCTVPEHIVRARCKTATQSLVVCGSVPLLTNLDQILHSVALELKRKVDFTYRSVLQLSNRLCFNIFILKRTVQYQDLHSLQPFNHYLVNGKA